MPTEELQQERAPLTDQDRQILNLVEAQDNRRDFREAVATVDDTHLAEVLAVNFMRSHYRNGSSPPYVVLQDEPLYDRVVSADPTTIDDPTRRSVVEGMQQLLTAKDYRRGVHTKNFEQDAEQRMLAFKVVPDMIRKYPITATLDIYSDIAHELNQPSAKREAVRDTAQELYIQAVDALADKCSQPIDPTTRWQTEDALDRLEPLYRALDLLEGQRVASQDEHLVEAQSKLNQVSQRILTEDFGFQGVQLQTVNAVLAHHERRDILIRDSDKFKSMAEQVSNPEFQSLVNGEEFQDLDGLTISSSYDLRDYVIHSVIDRRRKIEPEYDDTSSYIEGLKQALQDPEFMELILDPSRNYTSILIDTTDSVSPNDALKDVHHTFNDPLIVGITEKLKKFENPVSAVNVPMEQFEGEIVRELRSDKKRFTGVLHAIADNPRLSRLIDEPSSALMHFATAIYQRTFDPKQVIQAGSGIIADAYAQASKQTEWARIDQYTERVRSLCNDLSTINRDDDGHGKLFSGFLDDNPEMSAKDQFKSVKLFSALAKLGIDKPAKVESLAQLEATVVDGFIEELIGERIILSPNERDKLFESFGDLTALITYTQQFIDNADYTTAIAELSVTVADGTYDQWRRGDGSQMAMQEMIAKGYLPQSLTYAQYEEWIADRKSSSRTELVNSAKDTAKDIRYIFEHAAVDFNDFLPEYAEYGTDLSGIAVISERRNKLGQLLGAINNVAKAGEEALDPNELFAVVERVNAIPDLNENPDVTEALDMLENGILPKDLREQLTQRRQQLEYKRLLIRLANISPEEVAEGAFLKGEGSDGTAKVQDKILDVLEDMADNLPEGLRFIADSSIVFMRGYGDSTTHVEELTVEDTIDPKVTLEIGATPQNTCQHYDTGMYNQGLIGYFGPEVKILIVRNSSGGIVSRSITRLMQDDNGQPVLYAEPIYSAISGHQVTAMLNDHIKQKAEAMGVEVRGSLGDGKSKPKELTVRKLKMPATYSDGAGVSINKGSLRIAS